MTEIRDQHLRLPAVENFGRYGVPLLDLLALQPLMTVGFGVEKLGASPTTVGGLPEKANRLGIVEEITGKRRHRVYRYTPLLDLFIDQ